MEVLKNLSVVTGSGTKAFIELSKHPYKNGFPNYGRLHGYAWIEENNEPPHHSVSENIETVPELDRWWYMAAYITAVRNALLDTEHHYALILYGKKNNSTG